MVVVRNPPWLKVLIMVFTAGLGAAAVWLVSEIPASPVRHSLWIMAPVSIAAAFGYLAFWGVTLCRFMGRELYFDGDSFEIRSASGVERLSLADARVERRNGLQVFCLYHGDGSLAFACDYVAPGLRPLLAAIP